MADPLDLDHDDNWNGGFYELALQLGPRDDARLAAALAGVWAAARVHGCYARRLEGGRRHEPVPCDLDSLETRGHLKGVVRLEIGLEVVCGVVAVREEQDEMNDWLDFYLPLGALADADPRVGAYPFEEPESDGSFAWRAPLDTWLAEIGRRVFGVVPFRLGIIGFEVSGVTSATDLGGQAPVDRPQTGYLIPQADGLGFFPATS